MSLSTVSLIDMLISEGFTILRITEDEYTQDSKMRFSWWVCYEFKIAGIVGGETFNYNSVTGIEISDFINIVNLNVQKQYLISSFQSFIDKFENEKMSMDFSSLMKWKKYRK